MAQVTLTIDGQKVTAETGTNLIKAAASIGIAIPHFCYHPGLTIDGNCRMCLVEVEKIPKPVTACSTLVAEGMVVTTNSDKIKDIRRSVMEFLLVNHPLDCPTCDQAGECRLQDYYMTYDGEDSRIHESKVHKNKMIDLGAGVMLDQERCIACRRCIRVCKEVAGVDELALAFRGDHVMITTFPGQKLSNPYAGNTIDVCPVGALTNKDFRFKKRVWFLNKTSSVCMGCSRGCNIYIDHADSKVFRLRPRENPDVNKYWMCDEGRYGYHFVNDNRILRPHISNQGKIIEVSYERALQKLFEHLKNKSFTDIAVVAHSSESSETLYDFWSFAKDVLKAPFFYYSKHDPENPSGDDILITADKNSNQAEVNRLGFKPLSELNQSNGILVLNSLSERDWKIISQKNIPVLGLWTSNHSPLVKEAGVVLPIPTFAEQAGTYTNVQGRVQKTTKAFEPRGEARPVRDSLIVLKHLMEAHSINKKAV